MTEYTPTKRCCKCKRYLPRTPVYFNKNRSSPDGWHLECRECRRKQRNTTDTRKTPVLYRGNQKRCTSCLRYLDATIENYHRNKGGLHPRCRECRRKEKAKYQRENREHIKELRRDYLNHPDTRRRAVERAREWKKSNPERARRVRHNQVLKYRSRKKAVYESFSAADWQDCLNWWSGCCAYCGAQRDFWHRLESDHYIPLDSPNCPGTIPENIVPACRSCNASKANTFPEEWVVSRFGKSRGQKIIKRIVTYFDSLTS